MNHIVKNFDPMIEKHVMWLKKLHDETKNLSEGRLAEAVKENPFNKKVDPTSIPELHFVLSAKYTGAVLSKKAWIP